MIHVDIVDVAFDCRAKSILTWDPRKKSFLGLQGIAMGR